METIRPGDIVIADIPDPDGNPCDHRHPAMVLRASPNAVNVWLMGISTSLSTPLPSYWLPLPSKTGGHPITGLEESSFLKCNWTVPMPINQIGRVIGHVPTDTFEKAVEWAIKLVNRKKRSEPT
ncbi:MAG: type II toxin-antitoxin system PemK/MazF family toxin [Planctomycetes bacterium]|nr:type II toxin-antitoxin system PemK/MazF family toxin [Planctomycetota bacterium]